MKGFIWFYKFIQGILHTPPPNENILFVCLFLEGWGDSGAFFSLFPATFFLAIFAIRIFDVNDLCRYAMSLETVVKEKPEGIGTLTCVCNADCIVGTVLYQLSYQAN